MHARQRALGLQAPLTPQVMAGPETLASLSGAPVGIHSCALCSRRHPRALQRDGRSAQATGVPAQPQPTAQKARNGKGNLAHGDMLEHIAGAAAAKVHVTCRWHLHPVSLRPQWDTCTYSCTHSLRQHTHTHTHAHTHGFDHRCVLAPSCCGLTHAGMHKTSHTHTHAHSRR